MRAFDRAVTEIKEEVPLTEVSPHPFPLPIGWGEGEVIGDLGACGSTRWCGGSDRQVINHPSHPWHRRGNLPGFGL